MADPNGYVLVPVWEHTALLILAMLVLAVAAAVLIGLVWSLFQRDEDWFY